MIDGWGISCEIALTLRCWQPEVRIPFSWESAGDRDGGPHRIVAKDNNRFICFQSGPFKGPTWLETVLHDEMSLDLTDYKSPLVQVTAWCRQAKSHYLSQCWPRSILPHGTTRLQWVNLSTPLAISGSISTPNIEVLHCKALCMPTPNHIRPCIYTRNKCCQSVKTMCISDLHAAALLT